MGKFKITHDKIRQVLSVSFYRCIAVVEQSSRSAAESWFEYASEPAEGKRDKDLKLKARYSRGFRKFKRHYISLTYLPMILTRKSVWQGFLPGKVPVRASKLKWSVDSL